MRLTCQLEVQSQLKPSSVKKSCTCTLAVCKDKNNEPILLACTKQNVAGQKYKVKNLKKVYSSFVRDGISTLAFSDPPHNLLIKKANPLQLKSFLHFINKGEESNLRYSAPPTKIDVPVPTKMVVTRRANLPSYFPKSLESLSINNSDFIQVPLSVCQLHKLTKLDLSFNVIKSLPAELKQLQILRTLIVTNNSLTSLDSFPNLTHLIRLDLTSNKLSTLPESVCQLSNLSCLQVGDNQLTKLPDGIGKLGKLKGLIVPKNNINVLPSSFARLQLDHLDLYMNPLKQLETPVKEQIIPIPSLLEWAAQSVVLHRLPFSEEDISYQLVNYLKTECRFCSFCLQPVFTSVAPAVTSIDIKSKAFEIVAIDHTGRSKAPIEISKCFRHSQKPSRDEKSRNLQQLQLSFEMSL